MPVEHKCPKCGKILSRSTILRNHMRTHEGDKRYKCIICARAFVRSSDRTAHQETHDGLENRKHVCGRTNENGSIQGCGKRFRPKQDLHRHWKGATSAKCQTERPNPGDSSGDDATMAHHTMAPENLDPPEDREPEELHILVSTSGSSVTAPVMQTDILKVPLQFTATTYNTVSPQRTSFPGPGIPDHIVDRPFGQRYGPEHLLRLVMDNKARVFSNECKLRVHGHQDASQRLDSTIWEPSQSQACYMVLSEALRLAQQAIYDHTTLTFGPVCSIATELHKTTNISMMTLSCMLLGHPQWNIRLSETRRTMRQSLFQMTKATSGDSGDLRDAFLVLGDIWVAQQVAWLLSSPGTSTLGYIQHTDLFQRILAESEFFYIHTSNASIEYALPMGRQRLEQDIADEFGYSGGQLPVSGDIRKFPEWWPGPMSTNGALAFNFVLRSPTSSITSSQMIQASHPDQDDGLSLFSSPESGQNPLFEEAFDFPLIDENGDFQCMNEEFSMDTPTEEEIIDEWDMDFDVPDPPSQIAASGKRSIHPAMNWKQLNLLSRARNPPTEVPEDWRRLNSRAAKDKHRNPYFSSTVTWEQVRSAARSGKRSITPEICWDMVRSVAASAATVAGAGVVGYTVVVVAAPIGMMAMPYAGLFIWFLSCSEPTDKKTRS